MKTITVLTLLIVFGISSVSSQEKILKHESFNIDVKQVPYTRPYKIINEDTKSVSETKIFKSKNEEYFVIR